MQLSRIATGLVEPLLTLPRASATQAPPQPAIPIAAATPGARTAPVAINRSGNPGSPERVILEPAPDAPPAPQTHPMPELTVLPVRQPQKLASDLVLPRCLSHGGRRADLLVALPMAW